MKLSNPFSICILSLLITAETSSAFAKQSLFDQSKKTAFYSAVKNKKPDIQSGEMNLSSNALLWKSGYVGWTVKKNWSGYSSLLFHFINPGKKTISANLEIRDSHSSDYWSRVNHEMTIVPGDSSIRVPLSQLVGDSSRQGRSLDRNQIQSIILARMDSADKTPIKLVDIQLATDFNLSKLGIQAFDFGPSNSSVFPGFTEVHENTKYSEEQQYGWNELKSWNPYPHSQDALVPDSLFRSVIFVEAGTFTVNLKPGGYDVYLNIDFPADYWGQFPLYKERKVWIQNNLVVDEKLSREQASRLYFQGQDKDHHESEDPFFLFGTQEQHLKHWEAHVDQKKKLQVRFQGDQCALVPCFGMAPSALIIIPKEKKDLQKSFLTWLENARRNEFHQNWNEQTFSISKSDFESQKPKSNSTFSVLETPLMQEMPETPKPKDWHPLRSLQLRGVQKQIVLSSFAVLGLKSGDPYHVEFETQDPELTVLIELVSRRWTRQTPAGHTYSLAEKYLKPNSGFELTPGESQRIWVTINNPNISPGVHSGTFHISRQSEKIDVPLKIKILPLTLPDMDLPVGPFNSVIQESGWWKEESQERSRALQLLSLKKMREIGLNSFSFVPSLVARQQGSDITIQDFNATNSLQKLARDLGFKKLIAYNDILAGRDLCRDPLSPSQLSGLAKQLAAEAELHNWLPTDFLVCDEPLGSDIPQAIRRTQLLQSVEAGRIRFSSAFSDSVDAPGSSELYSSLSHPYLNQFILDKLKQHNKTWIYYNSADRTSFGFGLHQLKKNTLLEGRIAWSWNQNAGDPYNPFDSREDDINWCNSKADGQLQCTVFLDRHILEGLNDYRLSLLVSHLHAETPKLQMEQTRILDKLTHFTSVGRSPTVGSPHSEYQEDDDLRSEIFDWLESFSDEINVNEKRK
jgi:hypothetical protein